MGVMQTIRERLEAGATFPELEAEGFVKSSIYSAKKSLQPKNQSNKRSTGSILSHLANPPTHNPRHPGSDATDPELVSLRLELAKLKLQNEIQAVKGEDKRFGELADEVRRLQEWTVNTLCNPAETTAEVDPKVLHRWGDSELGYLRGDPRAKFRPPNHRP